MVRLLATLTLCGQEGELAQALMGNGVAASKSGLLAKLGWGWGRWPGRMDAKVICHRRGLIRSPGEAFACVAFVKQ
jgi:hypothetical protein